MSSFGATLIDFKKCKIDFLISSANKCIQGVPGFSFIVAEKNALKKCENNATSLSFDVYDQYINLEKSKQFRFTPPTHAILAFNQALKDFKNEGGVVGRMNRYKENKNIVFKGLKDLGFNSYLPYNIQGHIISSFEYPNDPNWNFERFYSLLNERNCVIYPGKISTGNYFRIGHIGDIFPKDSALLVAEIKTVCETMKTAKCYS